MTDKLYWAAPCKRCSGMIGYRDVRYRVDTWGREIAEELPEGIINRRCEHCGTVGVLVLRLLRPTPIKLLIPKLP
jgi:hypothetical protein